MDISPKPMKLFEPLQPLLDQLQKLMLEAPGSAKARAGLAVLVAQYFFTAAAAAVEGTGSMTHDELCLALIEAYKNSSRGGSQ